jgi:hypothetical protein
MDIKVAIDERLLTTYNPVRQRRASLLHVCMCTDVKVSTSCGLSFQ